jgi:hypothetical protein
MSLDNIKRIQVAGEQVDRIVGALRSAVDLPPMSHESAAAQPAGVNGALSQRHLSDQEFIECAAQLMSYGQRETADRHLAVCYTCSMEIKRLREQSSLWNDLIAVERFERRILQPAERTEHAASPNSRPVKASYPFHISLRPLVLPSGAYGEGVELEAPIIKFPVTENGQKIDGLLGALKRKNREFYIMISTTTKEIEELIGNRKVAITISDPREARPLLKRRVDISVTQLLGTDMRITNASVLTAEIAPVDPDGSV